MALAVAASVLAPVAARAAADCTDLVPSGARFPARNLVPEDLVRLRDIGPVDPNQQDEGLFSVSAEGTRAAFQLRRGYPAANDFCLAMLVVDLRSGAARVVDRGGAFLRLRMDARGAANFPSGYTDPITPRWSPDGKWIVYRRRDRGAVQLWLAQADGSGSAAITDSTDDIEDFRITPDGGGVVYTTRPGLGRALAAIEREGLSGFHYDDRFVPAASSRPFPTAPIASVTWHLDLGSRAVRPATPDEAALLDKPSMQEGSWSEHMSAAGNRAWVQVPAKSLYASRGRLVVTTRGRTLACDAPACANATQPWWVGGKVRFLRHEGWSNSVTAIYEWKPGAPSVRRLYATEDMLLGCVPSGGTLVCLREGALQPRRLERLEPESGQRTLLFDANPEFAGLTLGKVERLRSRNSFGIESFADLVLPVGYVRGRRYPLVVVQYHSRGFLRGGTGDDYPIQAFANRGFAVLSVDRPRAVGFESTTDALEADRINLKDFADRRSVLEAVETAVRTAIDRGVADPARIGITGLSDGASTAQYALLHSRLFSAFALSSCCWDSDLPLRVGPRAARQFAFIGYPATVDDSEQAKAFWRAFAVSRNARQIRAPVLAQVSDDEFWVALQSVTALRELDRPVDLYVFPGEHHVKWQPAHRLAVYTRALDWFDFWLNDVKAPGREEEIVHWEALRRGVSASEGGSAGAAPLP